MTSSPDDETAVTDHTVPAWLRASNRAIRAAVHVKRRRAPVLPSPGEVLGAAPIPLDDDRLVGWWRPHAHTAPVVLLVHGFGGSATHLAHVALGVHELGAHVLLLDDPTLPGPERDGRLRPPRPGESIETALAWIAAQDRIGRLGLVGHSMGASTALGVAASREDVHAVVTLGAVADPTETSMAGIPAPLSRAAARVVRTRTGFDMRSAFGSGAIGRVRAPVLVVHGTADRTVPPFNADVLVAAGPRAQRLLVEAQHRPHDVYAAARPSIDAFLRRHLGL